VCKIVAINRHHVRRHAMHVKTRVFVGWTNNITLKAPVPACVALAAKQPRKTPQLRYSPMSTAIQHKNRPVLCTPLLAPHPKESVQVSLQPAQKQAPPNQTERTTKGTCRYSNCLVKPGQMHINLYSLTHPREAIQIQSQAVCRQHCVWLRIAPLGGLHCAMREHVQQIESDSAAQTARCFSHLATHTCALLGSHVHTQTHKSRRAALDRVCTYDAAHASQLGLPITAMAVAANPTAKMHK
jgi:hypothetical protein